MLKCEIGHPVKEKCHEVKCKNLIDKFGNHIYGYNRKQVRKIFREDYTFNGVTRAESQTQGPPPKPKN